MNSTLLVIGFFLLAGCSQGGTLLELQPAWIGECSESSDSRVAAALSDVQFSRDGRELIGQLLSNLPSPEQAGIAASLEEARKLLGHNPTRADADRLRDDLARKAFFLGFDRAPTCDIDGGYITADFFTDSVIPYLYKRNVDVSELFLGLGSPASELNTDHEELKVWLLLGAADAL